MVRIFWVTSSPHSPSPRVAACTNTWSSYRKLMAKPSNFNSATYSTKSPDSFKPSSLRIRASKYSAPLAVVSVSVRMLSIGRAWRTVAKASKGLPPTRCVGESEVSNSGCVASKSCNSRNRRSYSASGTVGASNT